MESSANTVFVGQVPRDMQDHELKAFMEECGRVIHVNMLTDRNSGQFKGCAFVTFESADAASLAKESLHDKCRLPGATHPMQVTTARSKSGSGFGGSSGGHSGGGGGGGSSGGGGNHSHSSHGPGHGESRAESHQPRRKLFVGMLARTLADEDLRQMFLPFGDVEDCIILRNSDKTSKGCAFVTMMDMQSCQKAIVALHNSQTFQGCSGPMVVKFADTQAQKETRQRSRTDPPVPALPPPHHHHGGAALHPPHHHGVLPPMPAASSALPASPYGHMAHLPPQPAASASAGPDLSGLQNLLAPTMAQLVKQQQELQQQQRTINQALQMLGIPGASGALGGASDYPHSASAAAAAAAADLAGFGPPGATSALSSSYDSPLSLSAGALDSASAAGTSGPGGYRTGPDGSNLFIYHLASSATDNDLYQLFSAYGRVVSARVYCDRGTGQSKGFGFVSYDNPQSAQAAINSLNGYQMGGRRLKVQLKKGREGARPY